MPSHSRALERPKVKDELANCRVVAAYPQGVDIASSVERVPKYTEEAKALGSRLSLSMVR